MPVTIIVGAGQGLGYAIARRFALGGHDIGLVARSEHRLVLQAKKLTALGVRVVPSAVDASDTNALNRALDNITAKLGSADVAIYNAARLIPGGALATSTADIASDLGVNVLGAHALARYVAPAMLSMGHGAILFTGGGLALEPFPEWTSLALGKAALRNLSFSLHKELAPHGIRTAVIAICGIVETGGPFDPDHIAKLYWSAATESQEGLSREIIFQPDGTDPYYNDPQGRHRATTLAPAHIRGLS